MELVQSRVVTENVKGMADFYSRLIGIEVVLNDYYVEVPTGAMSVGFSRCRFTEFHEQGGSSDEGTAPRNDVVLDFLQTDTWSGMVNEANWIAGCWKDLPGRRLALSVPMLVHEGDPTLAQGAEGAFDQHFRELSRILVASGYADALRCPCSARRTSIKMLTTFSCPRMNGPNAWARSCA